MKEALLASGAVTSYPKTSLAKQAGDELVREYGFKKLPIRDPYAAPIKASAAKASLASLAEPLASISPAKPS